MIFLSRNTPPDCDPDVVVVVVDAVIDFDYVVVEQKHPPAGGPDVRRQRQRPQQAALPGHLPYQQV